jgi:site-specific DNA-methyltransferase (adenine-specific)
MLTPTFKTSMGVLYQSPCEDVLPQLPADSADMLLTDPPYSSGGATRSDRNLSTSTKYQNFATARYYPEFSGDNRDQISYALWCSDWLRAALRVVRSGGVAVVWSDWRQVAATHLALQMGGWVLRGMCVWDKTEAARPQLGRFRNQCEYALWATKGHAPTEGQALPGVFRKPVIAKEKRHVTGKPVGVVAGLLRICPAGGLVLDPFFGSGSTGMACESTGRRWIGVEQEPAYIDVARSWLQEPRDLRLLGVG